jgi:hypothetical protein
MIYELRLYSVAPGRMTDVHSRFNDHLPALFKRHGVDCVGRWTALAGPDAPRFVYLMAYRDYAQRETTWAAFYQDADWWSIRADTNAGHEMVERHDLFFIKPNAVWAAPTGAAAQEAVGGLHELVQQQVAPGQAAAVNEFMKQTWLPRLREAGARVLGVFDMAAGSGMQKVVLLYAWPDAAKWHAGHRQLEADESLRDELAAQRKKLGTTLFQRSEVNLLEPAPGMTIRAGLGRQLH